MTKKQEKQLEENLDKLPNACLVLKNVVSPGQSGIIMIAKGEAGYGNILHTREGKTDADVVREYNEMKGVTPEMIEAMIVGSMFGFHVPGANPDSYTKEV